MKLFSHQKYIEIVCCLYLFVISNNSIIGIVISFYFVHFIYPFHIQFDLFRKKKNFSKTITI